MHHRIGNIEPLTVFLTCLAMLGLAPQQSLGADEKAVGKQPAPSLRVAPKAPADAVATFRTLDGFRIDLLAAEPLVREPIVLRYDENGLLYVAEYLDFPYPTREGEPFIGRIKVLEDVDGDGTFDRSEVFADGLTWPAGIACWRGGIFVVATPDIWYLKDTDGDRVADVRERVYTGFGFADSDEAIANNLIWGLDHKIYGAAARSGGAVLKTNDLTAKPVALGGRDFRFDPDSGVFEAISGTDQFGNTFDDWDNRFVCNNSSPGSQVVLPARYLTRNPYLPVPKVLQRIWSDDRVYRVSKPEPWRVARSKIRRATGRKWAAPYVAHDVFTAVTGVTVYRGAAYPKEFHGNLFFGDVQGNLVHRSVLTPDGVTFRATRADKETEIVRATDNWFRPTNFVNAPDGTLHIADMYREVIETPASLPEEILARIDLSSGHDRGRIYRLAPKGFDVPPPPKLGSATTAELVRHLENPNGWWRDTAHRLLFERQDLSAVAALRAMATNSRRPQGRLHALWSLRGLRALTDADLSEALGDDSPRIREHAVRLAEHRLFISESLQSKVLALAGDDDARVRFQVAFSLGELGGASVAEALARIAVRDADDPWIRTAILSSVLGSADDLLARLLAQPDFLRRAKSDDFLRQLALVVGGRNRKDEVARTLGLLATADERPSAQRALLLGLGDGLRRSRTSLSVYVSDPSSPAAKLLSGFLEQAVRTAADSSKTPAQREQAIAMLGHGSFERSKPTLTTLLDARQPPAVQMAAVRALAGFADGAVAEILLHAWRGYSPPVRGEAVEALLSRREWIGPLFDAINARQVTVGQIEPQRRTALMRNADASIRARAVALFDNAVPGPRGEVIARYTPALKLEADPERGSKVFARECATCHRLGKSGFEVGPNLATIRNRGPENLLTQILDPSRELMPNYVDYIVTLDDGRVLTGLIASESATSVTLKRAQGAEDTLLRQNIEEMVTTGKSLMPEGFEQKIKPQEMADLLAFLSSLRP